MPSLFRVDKKVHGRVEPKRQVPVNIASASAAGSVLTVTFDQPVGLKRGTVPQITTDVVGADPISAAQTSANVVEITFDASIAAATTITIAFEDPAIRNAIGGFVADSTFPV